MCAFLPVPCFNPTATLVCAASSFNKTVPGTWGSLWSAIRQNEFVRWFAYLLKRLTPWWLSRSRTRRGAECDDVYLTAVGLKEKPSLRIWFISFRGLPRFSRRAGRATETLHKCGAWRITTMHNMLNMEIWLILTLAGRPRCGGICGGHSDACTPWLVGREPSLDGQMRPRGSLVLANVLVLVWPRKKVFPSRASFAVSLNATTWRVVSSVSAHRMVAPLGFRFVILILTALKQKHTRRSSSPALFI